MHHKGLIIAPDATQLNSTQLVELSRIGRYDHFSDPIRLNWTKQTGCQLWPDVIISLLITTNEVNNVPFVVSCTRVHQK